MSDVQVSGFITIKWIIHFSNGFCLVLNRYNRTKPGNVIMTIRLRHVAIPSKSTNRHLYITVVKGNSMLKI